MAKRKIQWHPLFARLLRPRVERYYEVQMNVPVGDLPREADLLLLRRREAKPAPLAGLWRWLTTWNVLEFKGPTVAARPRDLLLLVELGLGIERRLNSERRRQGQRLLGESEVSFWYLANRLGRRFLQRAEWRLGPLEGGEGLWRARALGFSCVLVSTVDLPVDEDSLALHVLGRESAEKEREVGRLVTGEADWLQVYRGVFATLHTRVWKEMKAMGKSTRRKMEFEFDIRPAVEYLGLDEVIRQIGEEAVIEQIGEEAFIKRIGEEAVIKRIGEEAVIKRIGKRQVLEKFDVEDILANLSPSKRQQLQRRLAGESGK
jgi:hypothetical protein